MSPRPLQHLLLDDGIFPEPAPDANRLVLWLKGSQDGAFQHWERIGTVPGPAIARENGICAVAASSIRARQPLRGFFGKLLARFRSAADERAWVLPTGETTEQVGERQTDHLLVWSEDHNVPLEEALLKARWPDATAVRKLGKALYLVAGVAPPHPPEMPCLPPPAGANPGEQAEHWLAAARQAGNRRQEVTTLTDLGVLLTQEGQAQRAVALLEEALAKARQLGEPARASDVLSNLGWAVLSTGQPARALDLFQTALAQARTANDPFAQKVALDRLGVTWANLKSPAQALPIFEGALALAQQVGDRQHQADLLWNLAIQHGELGQRDQAIARAQAAVALLEVMGKPQAALFADHLRHYRLGDAGAWPAGNNLEMPPDVFPGGTVVAAGWASQPSAGTAVPPGGPGWLLMAVSAAKSMARYLASGLQMVSPTVQQERLATCAACVHHTGLRCKLCGCFTAVKARLPHEDCPIGKWG